MNLELKVTKIQFIYDDGDTNAINFILDDNGYFSIQTCVYEEQDENFNQPFFEFKEQSNGQRGGLERIDFSTEKTLLTFKDNKLFMKRYKEVELLLNQPVDRKIVDFFANHLFVGDLIHYDGGFEISARVIQTEYREPPLETELP